MGNIAKLALVAVASVTMQCLSYGQADIAKPRASASFPYSFTNFIWWSDSELRAELKRRIPALGDEVASRSPQEARMRTALVDLLRAKGVHAEVQIVEPSLDVASQQRVAEAPAPSIAFTVTGPEIRYGRVDAEGAPPNAMELLGKAGKTYFEDKPYNANALWFAKSQMTQSIREAGYLSATLEIEPEPLQKKNAAYSVPMLVKIVSGPRYTVGSVSADGGPLLVGHDLSPYFVLKVGNAATTSAFGRLEGSIRSLYWKAGYADVSFRDEPVLDRDRALAAYRLETVPGPRYNIRTLQMTNLNAEQEAEARSLLDLKPGDVYDQLAVVGLDRKLSNASPLLRGYGVVFKPVKDKETHLVDLTLDFYKQQ